MRIEIVSLLLKTDKVWSEDIKFLLFIYFILFLFFIYLFIYFNLFILIYLFTLQNCNKNGRVKYSQLELVRDCQSG